MAPGLGDGGLSHAITIDQIVKEMRRCQTKQEAIDSELDGLLCKRQMVQRAIENATFPVPEIPLLQDEVQGMNAKLVETSLSAQGLSSKVQELDVAQSSLQRALSRVEAVLDLKSTIEKVKQAIAAKDLEQASSNIYRILHQQEVQENNSIYSVLYQLEDQVRGEVMQQCAAAQTAEDLPKVIRFCKMYPGCGRPYQGLLIYCQVARQQLADTLTRKNLTLASQPTAMARSDLLSKILDKVTETIQRHVGELQEHFCPGSHLMLLQQMQMELDSRLTQVLKQFIVDKKLVAMARHAKQLTTKDWRNQPAEENEHEVIDIMELDDTCEEISFVCREAEVLDANIRKVAKAALDTLHRQAGAGDKKARKILDGMARSGGGLELVHCSKVNEVIQQIIGHYIVLEEYYMIQNVKKAVRIDEHAGSEATAAPEEDAAAVVPGKRPVFGPQLAERFELSTTSTMVDDTFFILKKCTERAFGTCNGATACAIVNHINSILSRDYRGVLQAVIDHYAQTYLGGRSSTAAAGIFGDPTKLLAATKFFTSSGVDREEKKLSDDQRMLLTLNNLDQSTGYMLTLKEHLEQEYRATFETSDMKSMIDETLKEMAQTSNLFRDSVKDSGVGLLIESLRKRLDPLVEVFKTMDYAMDERQYEQRGLSDPFLPLIIKGLEQEILPLQKCLTEGNWNLFLSSLASFFTERLDKLIKKKRFTFWGGLQLDRDTRNFSKFFSGLCQGFHTVRDKFSKLVQISSILQLDKVGEIMEYWGDDSEVLRLPAWEVKKVLSLRVEFRESDIQNLAL